MFCCKLLNYIKKLTYSRHRYIVKSHLIVLITHEECLMNFQANSIYTCSNELNIFLLNCLRDYPSLRGSAISDKNQISLKKKKIYYNTYLLIFMNVNKYSMLHMTSH